MKSQRIFYTSLIYLAYTFVMIGQPSCFIQQLITLSFSREQNIYCGILPSYIWVFSSFLFVLLFTIYCMYFLFSQKHNRNSNQTIQAPQQTPTINQETIQTVVTQLHTTVPDTSSEEKQL
jgi:hypothetical protein